MLKGVIAIACGDFENVLKPKIISKFINHWEKADGREIDVNTHMSNLTLDIIGEVAFSHNFRALESIERWVNQDNDNYDMLDPIDDKVM